MERKLKKQQEPSYLETLKQDYIESQEEDKRLAEEFAYVSYEADALELEPIVQEEKGEKEHE